MGYAPPGVTTMCHTFTRATYASGADVISSRKRPITVWRSTSGFRREMQTCQHWLIVKRVKPPPLPLPFPSPTVTYFSLSPSLSLPILPLSPSFIQLGDLRSAVSSPIGSGQRVQPPNVFWCNGGQNLACRWVEGLEKWVNIFTDLRYLQW